MSLQQQVASSAQDAVSRMVRQVIQALIPTLLIVAAGSTTGIDVSAVVALAAIAGLVSLVKSVFQFRFGPGAPVWARTAERALTAAAGTALGLLTVDGVSPVNVVDWPELLTAVAGSAVLSVAMFYTNPPAALGGVMGRSVGRADRGLPE